MIEKQIDIWAAAWNADAVCITTNGVVKANGQAVMGAGVAREAAGRWPHVRSMLGASITLHGNHTSFIQSVRIERAGCDARFVPLVAVPVKEHWKEHANTVLIARSLIELMNLTDRCGWKKVVLPRPGCGNGMLDWDLTVKPMCDHLDDRFLVVWK